MLSLAITLCIVTGTMTFALAGQAPPAEYQVKAAFVYNFLTFVEWPSRTLNEADSLRVCIAGEFPDAAAFDELNGQELMGRKLTVRRMKSVENAQGCHVLFIGSSEGGRLSRLVESLKGSGTLTIGDTTGFAQRGVVINLYIDQKKVRFEINAEAARRAGLIISSKLLKLAGVVYGLAPAGN